MSNSPQKVHFIAIGGAVMHNLALALHQKGYQVTGSDDEIYDPAKSRLQSAGILPDNIGWNEENIKEDLDAVILGMHARKENPELLKAQKLGLKIYSFPEYVYEQSKEKQRIVIAGSHGKTSITSIILHVLKYYNRNFDYLVGAQIEGFDLMVKLSDDAPTIIIEGDEYLSSALEMRSKFLFYHPHIALFSGIAWDHFNVFPKFEDYVKAFEELADGLPKAGAIIFDETDNMVDVICEKEREDVNKVPYKAHPYEVKNGVSYLLTDNGKVPLKIFGEHNMKNLNGAKKILERLAITEEMFYEAIQSFSGAAKRLEKLGENKYTQIFRDFAHAPSKVEATTKAGKELQPERQLIACYELHTYSSLNKDFLPHYAEKLDAADRAVVFYSPHTLEIKKMPAISKDEIKKAFGRDDIEVFTTAEELDSFLKSQNWYNSNLLLMSSGTFGGTDLSQLAKEILEMPVDIPEGEKTAVKNKKSSKLRGIFKRKK
ncbi:UDP-N-acetylmuramate--L-alanine ligase [Jiulongibacter sediminis]|uniref:Peptidoglycan synthetase n=1 Tax=Jiulongibacter sediminis TaxID=1605367 RepID=A0A0N8HA44_9BACT|nr:Mur ligase family protein [Jiulongibacter sediminis]KPM49140.1 peptidoglycan synthetase [Jiulongibacter sediminis]TBX26196.1 peptidoglycan synthetase [Jiulongibacter sediminis]